MTATPSFATSRIDDFIGGNVRRLRDGADLTQEQLAGEMQARGFDFHQATVYKIETGRRSVSAAEVVALAQILSTSVDTLTAPEESPAERRAHRLRVRSQEAVRLALNLRLQMAALREMTRSLQIEANEVDKGLYPERFAIPFLHDLVELSKDPTPAALEEFAVGSGRARVMLREAGVTQHQIDGLIN